MLQVKGLTKEFVSGDTVVPAVQDVSLTVSEGEFAAIVGKSGSGKSTLLALLGALDRPTSGSVLVGGKDIAKMSDAEMTRYRRGTIGFVFQQYNLIPNLTALENVMLPMEFASVPAAKCRLRAQALLQRVGLDRSKQERRPARLSGGEQQRVAIARALANQPTLILADEPTGSLDSQTGKEIFDLLRDLTRSQKTTIIAVTHDDSIASKTDKTFKISDGMITN